MRDFRSLLQRTKGGSINYFSPIILHKEDCSINMSIQASRFNYSSPRIDNLSAYDYDEFEVAFMRDGEFVNPIGIDFGYDQVLPYIPVNEVQSMFEKFMSLNSGKIAEAPILKLGGWEEEDSEQD